MEHNESRIRHWEIVSLTKKMKRKIRPTHYLNTENFINSQTFFPSPP
jgi:hypothetical protein